MSALAKIESGDDLQRASLRENEGRLLVRFAERLLVELGPALHAVWLFGSRARGEPPAEYSDVDLLVLVDDASWEGKLRVHEVLETVAREHALDALVLSFSLHINSLAWLEQRRSVHSFFIAEVDRDKIVVVGSP